LEEGGLYVTAELRVEDFDEFSGEAMNDGFEDDH
jgi:hypothetical protein